jgi:hypothetical protein
MISIYKTIVWRHGVCRHSRRRQCLRLATASIEWWIQVILPYLVTTSCWKQKFLTMSFCVEFIFDGFNALNSILNKFDFASQDHYIEGLWPIIAPFLYWLVKCTSPNLWYLDFMKCVMWKVFLSFIARQFLTLQCLQYLPPPPPINLSK